LITKETEGQKTYKLSFHMPRSPSVFRFIGRQHNIGQLDDDLKRPTTSAKLILQGKWLGRLLDVVSVERARLWQNSPPDVFLPVPPDIGIAVGPTFVA
jgi:hypothetical protein